jgi:Pyruvate/2-oxoacid:ferredoxin oxidoreductase delta subunit
MQDKTIFKNRMIQKKDGVIGPIEPKIPNVKVKAFGDYPSVPRSYLEVAENYGPDLSGPPLCDELVELICHMFTEDEADILRHLKPGEYKTAAEMAERAHRPEEEVQKVLNALAREKYIIMSAGRPPQTRYFLIPIVPGAFETILVRTSMDTLTDWHKKFAKLYSTLYDTGFSALKSKVQKPGIRYLPVGEVIESVQYALPYDYFAEYIERFDDFAVALCQCRMVEELAGRGCGRPMENCTSMGKSALAMVKSGRGRKVEKQELLEIKKKAEASGLVTWAMLLEREGNSTSCSCCGCCCGMMRSISEFNMPGRIAPPHFLPECDLDKCSYCGKCALGCPMGAITIDTKNKTRGFAAERCIGCGLCLVQCEKEQALTLKPVPGFEAPEIKIRPGRNFLSGLSGE